MFCNGWWKGNFPPFGFLSVLSSDVLFCLLIFYKRKLFLIFSFLWPCFTLVIRNGKIVWKVSGSSITCSWTLVPEDTCTQAISAYNRCKHWMCRKVRMVKTTVFFICDQLFGSLVHLNFTVLILICF